MKLGFSFNPLFTIYKNTVVLLNVRFLIGIFVFLLFEGLSYSIYIIEQYGSLEEPFNRAKLFNVGVVEGIFNDEVRQEIKNGGRKMCYCIILHDVDMVPVSNVIMYILKA